MTENKPSKALRPVNAVTVARKEYQRTILDKWEKDRQTEVAAIAAEMLVREGIAKIEVFADGKHEWTAFNAAETEDTE
jgi:hypothetical protein